MGEYKPLGSEKLKNDEKLKRILELTYYNEKTKKSSFKPELVKESKSGKVYGIVKEKDGYYVKMGLNEQSLDYIGGLFMKNKNKFPSYSEALKRLELLRGQDSRLNEATKYVLKKNQQTEQDVAPDAGAKPPPADMGAPAPDAGAMPPPADMSAPAPDAGAPAPDAGAMPPPADMGAPAPDATTPEGQSKQAETKRSDYMAEVQKFAGKLGQELRDQKEKMEGDDIKYVLNMVISAVDLDKLELEDLEEIGKKFDREEEAPSDEVPVGSELPDAEQAEEPAGDEVPTPIETQESELFEFDDENDGMKELEEFINSEIDLSSYSDEKPKEDLDEEGQWNEEEWDETEDENTLEVDMDKVKAEVTKSVEDVLKKYFTDKD